MVLLNPRSLTRRYPDARSAEVMRKTIEFFEAKGKTPPQGRLPRARLVRGLPRVRPARADLRDHARRRPATARADARWDTWRICEFAEILGFYGLQYWYTWQVTVLGSRTDLDEPQRGREAARRAPARGRRHLRVRPLGEGARRRHLLDRDDAHARRRGRATSRTAASTTSATATRPRWSRRSARSAAAARVGRLRLLRRRPAAPERYELREERGGEPELRLRVRAARLPDHRGATSSPRGRTPGTPRSTPSTSASSTSAGRRSASARTPSTRRSATPRTGGSTACTSPTSRTCRRMFIDAYARLVAMKLFALRAADYMRSASRRGPPLPALQPDGEDEGDHAGRGRDQPALGRDRRQGLREGHVLRDGGARHPRAAEARGHGAREHRADREVHGELLLRAGGTARGAAPRRRGQRRLPLRAGADPRARQRSGSTTTGRRFASCDLPNVALLRASRSRSSGRCSPTAPPDEAQRKDVDFLLAVGELFTLVVYAQLILENARIYGVDAGAGRPDLRRPGARLLASRRRAPRHAVRATRSRWRSRCG